jgi:heme-degrading monooxygenase HmoA
MHVKHNKARVKPGKRDEVAKTLVDFYNENEGNMKGYKGLVVIQNLHDPQEIIALTFWETKQDMDAYHSPDNKLLTSLQEKTEPNREGPVERRDYTVAHIKIR